MADEPKAPGSQADRGLFEPKVYVPPPKEGTRAAFGSETASTEPLVTEGMKARKRHEERARREENLAQLEREEKSLEIWAQIRSVSLKLGLALGLVLLYLQIQNKYPDNRWPLELVWGLIVVGVFGGFFWSIWYMNKAD
jgi:hypothetical protein